MRVKELIERLQHVSGDKDVEVLIRTVNGNFRKVINAYGSLNSTPFREPETVVIVEEDLVR